MMSGTASPQDAPFATTDDTATPGTQPEQQEPTMTELEATPTPQDSARSSSPPAVASPQQDEKESEPKANENTQEGISRCRTPSPQPASSRGSSLQPTPSPEPAKKEDMSATPKKSVDVSEQETKSDGAKDANETPRSSTDASSTQVTPERNNANNDDVVDPEELERPESKPALDSDPMDPYLRPVSHRGSVTTLGSSGKRLLKSGPEGRRSGDSLQMDRAKLERRPRVPAVATKRKVPAGSNAPRRTDASGSRATALSGSGSPSKGALGDVESGDDGDGMSPMRVGASVAPSRSSNMDSARGAAVPVGMPTAPQEVEDTSEIMKRLEAALAERAVLLDALNVERAAKRKLTTKCESSENSAKAVSAELDKLKARLAGLQRNADKLASQGTLAELEDKIDDTDASYRLLKEEYAAIEKKVRELESSKSTKVQFRATLEVQRQKDGSKSAVQWERRVALLKREVTQLEMKLQQYSGGGGAFDEDGDADAEDTADEVSPQRTMGDVLAHDIAVMDASVAQRRKAEQDRLKREWTKEGDAQERELQAMLANERRIQADVNAACAQVALQEQAQQRELQTLRDDAKTADHRAWDTQRQIESLNQRAATLTATCDELQKEVHTLRTREQAMKKELTAALQQASSLPELEAKAWAREAEALQMKSSGLDKRIEELHQSKSAAAEKLKEVQGRSQTHAAARKRVDAAAAEKRSLKEKLTALELKVEATNRQADEVHREAAASQKDSVLLQLREQIASHNHKREATEKSNQDLRARLAKATKLLRDNGIEMT